ncbi:MAG: response regulator [Rhodocyclaceae bacterium]|nr:response regulator [Rhodocyclaceae bacterium]MDZ4213467.1 response regulator [Rhodocyclaceae bacterium]
MLCRVLLVDDDPLVVSALRRELLRKPDLGNEGIEIESFPDAPSALSRAAESDGFFDVAIVDYRMRGMDGIRFLEKLRVAQPDTIRILLTGLLDMEGAIAAINDARVDQVVLKPWGEYDLKTRILLAMQQRKLLRRLSEMPVDAPASPSRYSILLVDDETSQLHALERELSLQGRATRGANPLFDIMTESTPAAALVMALQRCPDIVIADYQMPKMDGVMLLEKVQEACPGSVRILMSGVPATQVLVDAINRAGVYHFVSKPWEAVALRAVIAEALRYRDLILKAG